MGVWGIFVGMVLESACIPIPSEVLMLSGGVLVAQHSLTFAQAVAAGVLGNLIGSVIAYYAGAIGGRRLLERYGKYILFNEKHMDHAQRWFDKYGQRMVFLTRMLPFIRTFISLPAGIARMNAGKFVLFTFLGCMSWNIALVYLGYRLGDHWDAVEKFMHPVSYLLAAATVCAIAWWLVKRRRDQSTQNNGGI
ncbi:DedA family protein [Cohnella sp. GCM10012308]|uniref:DedA family protein n=1 Tax=Cohnella sp. GCM10012308 TaxID=3317329 RepID=UPI00361CE809